MKKNNIKKEFNKVYSNGVTPYVTKAEAIKIYSASMSKAEDSNINSYVESELNNIEKIYKNHHVSA